MDVANLFSRIRVTVSTSSPLVVTACLLPVVAAVPVETALGADTPTPAEIRLGEELFTREWLPNDSRSHGGDGLGPVFNDSSCVACHNQGGVGGGGAASKNVEIISAFVLPQTIFVQQPPE